MPGKRPFSALLRSRWVRILALAAVAAGLGVVPAARGAETDIGNNLSFPTIWSEGTTLTLLGTYGSPSLTVPYEYTDPVTGETLTLYLQGVAGNSWQAENVAPTEPVNVSQVDWGDNLESRSLSTGKPIRVETTLLEDLVDTTMSGFTMYSAGGTQDAEQFGTDGSEYDSTQAAIYSACMRLTIQRLAISRDDPYVADLTWDAATSSWTGQGMVETPFVDEAYSAEINGSGKVVYGYNWTATDVAGDYRVTASLDPTCATALNTFITDATTIYTTSETETSTTDGEVTAAAQGDSGGSGGSGGGGDTVGSAAKIDAADNLTYIDVRLGTPTYAPYVPPPANTVLPAISGVTTQGEMLRTSTGTWDNEPTSYSYQWEYCDTDGANCVDIAGATGGSYTLVSADVGHTMRVVVTATNDFGSTEATSAVTGVVRGLSSPTTTTTTGGDQKKQGDQARQRTRARLTLHLRWLKHERLRAWGLVYPAHNGQRLLIQRRTHDGWRTVARPRLLKGTTQRSRFTVTLSHMAAGQYRAFLGSDKLHLASASKILRARGLARLTLRLQHAQGGERHRLVGVVRPARDGARLMIQRRTHNGWRNVARPRLRHATRYVSRYAFTFAHLRPGTYRAHLGGNAVLRPSNSGLLKVR